MSKTSRPRTPLLSLVALALALVASLASTTAGAASDDEVYGLELVPWSKRVEEGRYQSARDYEATKKFYKDKFKGWKFIRWHAEVSLPTVKYVHVENTAPKRSWDGVNIYELPGGHVRYTVLPHVKTVEAKAPDASTPDAKASDAKASDASAPSSEKPRP